MVSLPHGYEKFVQYVPKNHKFHERQLVMHMIKSGESIEWVIEALFSGRKIKGSSGEVSSLYMNESF